MIEIKDVVGQATNNGKSDSYRRFRLIPFIAILVFTKTKMIHMKNIFFLIGLLICFGSLSAQDKVFTVVEHMPEFPGGDEALVSFIQKNIQYPDDAREIGVQGRVIVVFVVNEDGSISDMKIKKSVWPSIDKEVLRVMTLLPNFKPGTQQGKKVKVTYVLPVAVRLAGSELWPLENPAAGETENQANKLCKKENYKKALPLYKSVCEQDPDNNFAAHNLGICLYMTGDKEGAYATWSKLKNKGFHTADFLLDKFFRSR